MNLYFSVRMKIEPLAGQPSRRVVVPHPTLEDERRPLTIKGEGKNI
jgi:hypothetical protein